MPLKERAARQSGSFSRNLFISLMVICTATMATASMADHDKHGKNEAIRPGGGDYYDPSTYKGDHDRYYRRKKHKKQKPLQDVIVHPHGRRAGAHFKSIGEALKAQERGTVAHGARIYVRGNPERNSAPNSADYSETLNIKHPVHIIGQAGQIGYDYGRIIVASRGDFCARIKAPAGVTIQNIEFKVINARTVACIDALAGNVTLESLYIRMQNEGVAVRLSSNQASLRDNEIRGGAVGVEINLGEANTRRRQIRGTFMLQQNSIYEADVGILIRDENPLSPPLFNSGPQITMQLNEIMRNRYAGIRVVGAADPMVFENFVAENLGNGLEIERGGGEYKANDFIGNHGSGIFLGATDMMPAVSNNLIVENHVHGIEIDLEEDITRLSGVIQDNQIFGNRQQCSNFFNERGASRIDDYYSDDSSRSLTFFPSQCSRGIDMDHCRKKFWPRARSKCIKALMGYEKRAEDN